MRAGACAVVRAFALHQCSLGSIAEATPFVACVSCLLILDSSSRRFSLKTGGLLLLPRTKICFALWSSQFVVNYVLSRLSSSIRGMDRRISFMYANRFEGTQIGFKRGFLNEMQNMLVWVGF